MLIASDGSAFFGNGFNCFIAVDINAIPDLACESDSLAQHDITSVRMAELKDNDTTGAASTS